MIILGPVAVAKNSVIGGDNDLPWYLPEDLRHFKKITMGQTVLMGRKTFESIIKRLNKPLPDRKNAVVTRQKDFTAPKGVLVFHSLEEAFKALSAEDVYIIGGAQIFAQTLPLAEKMYITKVHQDYPGDAFFPKVDFSRWKLLEQEDHEGYSFTVYRRM